MVEAGRLSLGEIGRRSAGAGFAILVVGVAAFVGGYRLADREGEPGSASFHNMLVLSPPSLSALVDGSDAQVKELAHRLGTPQEAYLFVRDRIAFDPSRAAGSPRETLHEGTASCLGKAALLASLYRAQGVPDGEVRVVTGQVYWKDGPVEHVWLEIEQGGRCLQQDATPLFGVFAFDEFPGMAYTRAHVRRELFCFNDRGFAVVSQRNRFREDEPVGLPGP